MYCVKCGVELADSERKCPLCATPVYFPGLDPDPERPFPTLPAEKDKVNPRGIYLVVTVAFAISALISLYADMDMNGKLDWSAYVLGALAFSYTVLILPGWFYRPSPAVFVPVNFAVLGAYVWLISFLTGGDWFFGFALPIIGGVALIVCSVIIVSYYVRRGYLYIYGGAMIALGALAVLIEWLIHREFSVDHSFLWSPYPAITFAMVGIMLIVVAIVRPFRESLARIFSL